MLLPRPRAVSEEESDPRAELVRRLQEYERFKKAAAEIDEMPRMEREWFDVVVDFERAADSQPLPDVALAAVLEAFRDVLRRTCSPITGSNVSPCRCASA